ncbi:MAG TPA: hypothetical protein VNU47_02785 [Candidatus Paceibacterota bacterium]|nr:hypothetical protein [Candidatus Paceibacterota bacterium]
MATRKQTAAARENVRKAQAAWKGMTKRQHALAQPQGRGRKKPGTAGTGKFYRIEVRSKGQFTSFRTQDVGEKGGLERVAGRRSSGSWATATWLVSKEHAHVNTKGELVIDDKKERASLAKALRGKIMHVKGDIFTAHPVKNVPERVKPTPAMKQAQKTNIKKAQAARKKR